MNFPSTDLKTLLSEYTFGIITHGTVTVSTFRKWETIVQVSSAAEGVIVEITNSTTLLIYITSGTWDDSNVFVGQTSGATATASAEETYKPSIKFKYDDAETTFQSDGYVEIMGESLNATNLMKFHKDEIYRIPIVLYFDIDHDDIDVSNRPTTDGILRLYNFVKYNLERGNKQVPRLYIWDFTYVWNGLATNSKLDLFVDVQKIWVST